MANKVLIEKRKELEAKQDKLKGIFDEAGPDRDMSLVVSLEGSSKDKVEKIGQLSEELNEIADEVKSLADVERIAEQTYAREAAEEKAREGGAPDPGSFQLPAGPAVGAKSFGQLFVESDAYKAYASDKSINKTSEIKIGPDRLKTLMETTAGWAPESLRTGRVVLDAQRPIEVTDLIPAGDTNSENVVFMEETTFTNNAAEVAEAGTYGEAALVLTEQTSPVRKIGVWLPITDEQLEDVAQAQSYVSQRLPFMVRQRLDGQILTGDGVAPNLDGILNVAGIQTQAKGGDTSPDAIYKALVLVRVTGRANPTNVILHPNDWTPIRLLKTADGIYIWGSPSEAGPERIWGLPVTQTSAETENTGLVGDFAQFIQLAWKRDLELRITDAHSDFFIKGKQAIRADIRVALPVFRPAAFCSVTGL